MLHVYSDGFLQRDKKVEAEKVKSLPMPFKDATKCYMTKINLEYPHLILKNSKLATIGFKYINGNWQRKFSIEPLRIDIKTVYGPFLLGIS